MTQVFGTLFSVVMILTIVSLAPLMTNTLFGLVGDLGAQVSGGLACMSNAAQGGAGC